MHSLDAELAAEDDIPDLPVERVLLDKLKERVQLARDIDKVQHSATKKKHEKNWLKITAEALELELSDDEWIHLYLRFLIVDDDPCSDSYEKTNGVKDNSVQVKAMKKELRELLSEPILASGVSRKFITSGSRPIVEDLIRGQSMLSSIILMLLILLIFIMIDHDTFLGLKVIAAQDDIAAKRKVKSKARGKKIQASSWYRHAFHCRCTFIRCTDYTFRTIYK